MNRFARSCRLTTDVSCCCFKPTFCFSSIFSVQNKPEFFYFFLRIRRWYSVPASEAGIIFHFSELSNEYSCFYFHDSNFQTQCCDVNSKAGRHTLLSNAAVCVVSVCVCVSRVCVCVCVCVCVLQEKHAKETDLFVDWRAWQIQRGAGSVTDSG